MIHKRDFFDYCHECIFYDKCDGPEAPADNSDWGADSDPIKKLGDAEDF